MRLIAFIIVSFSSRRTGLPFFLNRTSALHEVEDFPRPYMAPPAKSHNAHLWKSLHPACKGGGSGRLRRCGRLCPLR